MATLYDTDGGGDSTDEDDGPPYEVPEEYQVMEHNPSIGSAGIVGQQIAPRFEDGWYEGKVIRQITMSLRTQENGQYAIKYPDSRKEFNHDFFSEDYGVDKTWVLIAPKCDTKSAP